MEEMPLLDGLAGEVGGEELGAEEETSDPGAKAREKLTEFEQMTTDAEAVAATNPDAAAAAQTCREASDEAAALIPAVEEAAKEVAAAELGSAEADAAREKLNEARAALEGPYERCKEAFAMAMGTMPEVSDEGLGMWADMKMSGGNSGSY